MTPISFRTARPKGFATLVAALGFVAAGIFVIIVDRRNLFLGMASIVFFGACAIVFAMQLLDGRARIVIDDRGVFDRTLKVGVIAWSDILDARVVDVAGHPFITLRLRAESRYLERVGAVQRRLVELNRQLGFGALNINLTAIPTDPFELAALIAREAELRRAPAADPYRST